MKKLLLFVSVFAFTLMLYTAQPIYAMQFDDSLDFSSKKITFLGDSLTAGSQIAEGDRFVHLVGEELNFEEYVNMGLDGSSVSPRDGRTDSFVERAEDVPTDSNYVFIMGGYNDIFNEVPIETFSTQLVYLINYLKTNVPEAQIVLMTYFDRGSTKHNLAGEVLNDFFDEVRLISADSLVEGESTLSGRVQLLDLYNIIELTTDEVDLYTYDGLHPSASGHRVLANAIISYLGGKNIDETENYSTGLIDDTGNLVATQDYLYSEPIAITPGRSYSVYANNSDTGYETLGTVGCYYQADGTFISEIPSQFNTNIVVSAPENSAYMIINIKATNIDDFYVRELVDGFSIDFMKESREDIVSVIDTNGLIAIPEDPTREGFIFDGWYIDTAYSIQFDFTSTVTDNATLYAKWLVDDSIIESSTPSTIEPSFNTYEFLSIDWYWYALAGVGLLVLLNTKEGKKFRKRYFK